MTPIEQTAAILRPWLGSDFVAENAQFFYRKLGYVDCGGLVFQGTPNSQPMEMFMRKVLD